MSSSGNNDNQSSPHTSSYSETLKKEPLKAGLLAGKSAWVIVDCCNYLVGKDGDMISTQLKLLDLL